MYISTLKEEVDCLMCENKEILQTWYEELIILLKKKRKEDAIRTLVQVECGVTFY